MGYKFEQRVNHGWRLQRMVINCSTYRIVFEATTWNEQKQCLLARTSIISATASVPPQLLIVLCPVLCL